MLKRLRNSIPFILAFIMASIVIIAFGIGCFYFGVIYGKKQITNKYFVDGSEKYLEDLKLDIPNEISQLNTLDDSTLDLLAGYIDTSAKVISLGFSGKQIRTATYVFIPDNGRIFVSEDSVLNSAVIDSKPKKK